MQQKVWDKVGQIFCFIEGQFLAQIKCQIVEQIDCVDAALAGKSFGQYLTQIFCFMEGLYLTRIQFLIV